MKKFLLALLAGMIALSILAACDNDTATNDDEDEDDDQEVITTTVKSDLNITPTTTTQKTPTETEKPETTAPVVTEKPETTAPVVTEKPETTAPVVTEKPETEVPTPPETEVPDVTDPSAALVGTWTAQFDVADMMNETMDFETDLSLYASMTFIFRSDSTVEYIMEISPDDYFDFIVKASEEQIYLQAQQDGMTKEDVDAMFQMTMGMTVSEYVVAYVNESAEVLQEAMDDMNTHETGVYYVEDNQLFVGDDLDSCDGTPYTLSGNTLTIMDSESDMAITLSRTAN